MSKKTLALIAAIVVIVAGVATAIVVGNHQSNSKNNGSMSGMSMSSDKKMNMSSSMDMSSSMSDMSGMKMDESLPTNLKAAENPKYPIGTAITLEATHMSGMKGAQGTVAAVYDTKVYEVTYQPTNGGQKVTGHKWLTKDDFKDMKDHKKGDKVTLESDHMPNMKGAKATITKVEDGPAYAVNYQPTTGGNMVMNHKYLVESEIQAR
ncbi:YdhK family protein [Fructobacillus fructosus]|uniref:YdhK family protein n=1 Tax=Fructobacillus fructosus TaxID=1631 RepID=UPI001658B677|nr:YdhK family protein [Fructobacillus fructosus]MBC9118506.1 YdhK family protein [Fructobacillus fructosus]MBD9364983.1 YdhK family protein [Leuconostoc mesenteroides]